MNIKQFLNKNHRTVIGQNFKDRKNNPSENITLFYFNLSDPPLDIDSSLENLVTYDPDPLLDRGRDKVEEIFTKSFNTGWVETTTTMTENGFEIYIDNKLLPQDFFYTDQLNKYNRWFLGYKDNLTGEINACVYGHETRKIIQNNSQNTIKLKLDMNCEFFLTNTSNNEYINYLENYYLDNKKPIENLYRVSELDRKYLNEESLDKSIGVVAFKRGKIHLSNE